MHKTTEQAHSFKHGELIRTPDHRVATVNRTFYAGDQHLRVECTDGTSWLAQNCQPALER